MDWPGLAASGRSGFWLWSSTLPHPAWRGRLRCRYVDSWNPKQPLLTVNTCGSGSPGPAWPSSRCGQNEGSFVVGRGLPHTAQPSCPSYPECLSLRLTHSFIHFSKSLDAGGWAAAKETCSPPGGLRSACGALPVASPCLPP